MDKLSNLRPAKGATKKRKRIGRGQGSGHGGTSTRGNKGAQARASYSAKAGFEGGQMPLTRRVPKFGFTPHKRTRYMGVNLSRLQELVTKGKVTAEVTPEILYTLGVVSQRGALVKILANGELSAILSVTAHGFSAAAKEKILAAGGSVTVA
jgi:large subunit ribosomal protein L15